jgi:hypothetical protein
MGVCRLHTCLTRAARGVNSRCSRPTDELFERCCRSPASRGRLSLGRARAPEPQSLPRTSRPTHQHSLDPTPGQPGPHPTRSRVPPLRAPGPPDLELRSHARRRRPAQPQSRGPWLTGPGDHAPSPQVPSCSGSTPWDAQDGSHGRRGPVPSSHKTSPSVIQDESLGPTRRLSGTTTRLSAPTRRPRDRTKTRSARRRDPPSSPERLEWHDHQVPDPQGKDSSRAVT